MASSQSPVPSDTVKVEDSADAVDNESTPAPAAVNDDSNALSKETYQMMDSVMKYLSEYKQEYVSINAQFSLVKTNALYSDQLVSAMFQRKVQKRLLPDYYDVIKEPVAFSTIRVCW